MKKERDLFSIGEVARALNITRRAILYYEEFGLIRPDVKDGATGNRYYTIDTFVKLRTIRILQNLGLSLSDVLGYFDGDFALAPLIRRLEAQRDELDRHIESLRERSGAEPPQVKLIRLLPQTVYRRVCAAATVAERTTLLRSTALEGMRLYGQTSPTGCTWWSRPSTNRTRWRSAWLSRRRAGGSTWRPCRQRRPSVSTTTVRMSSCLRW